MSSQTIIASLILFVNAFPAIDPCPTRLRQPAKHGEHLERHDSHIAEYPAKALRQLSDAESWYPVGDVCVDNGTRI